MGYSADEWMQLEADLRERHLPANAELGEANDYGTRYIIAAELTGPDGSTVLFRSIWQIDIGTDRPRFITMYPEHQP